VWQTKDINLKGVKKMNNGFKTGMWVGSILGAVFGMAAVNRMDPMHKRKMMRSTRRAFYNIRNGIMSLW
jgi:surface antigen